MHILSDKKKVLFEFYNSTIIFKFRISFEKQRSNLKINDLSIFQNDRGKPQQMMGGGGKEPPAAREPQVADPCSVILHTHSATGIKMVDTSIRCQ